MNSTILASLRSIFTFFFALAIMLSCQAQNYPNPFNPDTRISFELPEQTHVRLTVYNILGRPVRTLVSEERQPGVHSIIFDASGLSSGTYIYEITAGSFVDRKKMMLLK